MIRKARSPAPSFFVLDVDDERCLGGKEAPKGKYCAKKRQIVRKKGQNPYTKLKIYVII